MDSKETTASLPSHQQGFINYRNPSPDALFGSTSTSQSIHQGLTFGSLTQQPMDQRTIGFGDGWSASLQNQNLQQQQPAKRKRGRPRKNIPDGEGGNAKSVDPPAKRGRGRPRKNIPDGGGEVGGPPLAKRGRGRPPRSGEKQLDAFERAVRTVGLGFTPHIIEVVMGEDIGLKVKEFLDQESRSVFILSASGAISSAKLSGTGSYEGRFEIITLSGLFVNRNGSLKVAFAELEGRIVGGTVIGSLVAATKAQVIVGSFDSETKKGISGENSGRQNNELAKRLNNGSGSQGPSSDSSEQNQSAT